MLEMFPNTEIHGKARRGGCVAGGDDSFSVVLIIIYVIPSMYMSYLYTATHLAIINT